MPVPRTTPKTTHTASCICRVSVHARRCCVVQVRSTAQHVIDGYLDGVNFDYEDPLSREGAYRYTALVNLTAHVLHTLNPAYQVRGMRHFGYACTHTHARTHTRARAHTPNVTHHTLGYGGRDA